MLADRLTEEGIEVLLDQYEIPGNSLTSFMQDGIAKADKVIIVGTPRYKEKANSHKSGTNIEDQIINIHMGRDFTNPKFIPVLRKGGFADSFTVMVSDRFGFDFSDDAKFESEFERLVGGLYGKSKRPEKKHEIQWTLSLNEKQISGTYFGPLKDGKPEGIGHFIGKNGEDYRGTFKEGECYGNGKLVCDGNVFEGKFSNGSSVNGIKTTDDGNIERGEFKNGLLNGKGKKTDSDGGVEEGDFKDSLLNGKGKRTFPDGQVEEGEFKDGRLNGKGIIIWALDEEGIEYSGVDEGDFMDGFLNGKGKRTDSEGLVEEGEFKNGELNGKGIRTYPDGRVEEGEFKNGKLPGQDKKIHSDGRVDEGFFKGGMLFGQGKRTYPDGRVDEGEFIGGGLRQGKKTYPDGKVKEGTFSWGKLHGQGRIIYPDGRVVEGEFKYGKLINKKQ